MKTRLLAFTIFSLAVELALAESGATDSASSKTTKAPRSISAIQATVHAALREEASTRRAGNNTPQVLQLVDLYREMAAHPQRDTSIALRELGQQVRARLVSVKDHVNRHSGPTIGKTTKGVKTPTSLAAPANHLLAQQLPAPAKPANNAANQPAAPAPNAAASRRPTDYGPELVALIEATISPDTWNINGGPGTIVYYGPKSAIVVSAPDDVHGEVGGVLGQLRAGQ